MCIRTSVEHKLHHSVQLHGMNQLHTVILCITGYIILQVIGATAYHYFENVEYLVTSVEYTVAGSAASCPLMHCVHCRLWVSVVIS